MHMIPPRTISTGFHVLPDGPQRLAAELWGPKASPEEILQRMREWMATVQRPIVAVGPAMEAIAWAHRLPQLEKVVAPADWQALYDLLGKMTAEVEDADMGTRPLVHQLLAAELALTLAVRLPEGKTRRLMAKAGHAAAALGLGRILDAQGLPAAEHFHLMRSLLACWTRCHRMSQDLAEAAWGPRMQQRFDRLVRNVLRTARPDGRPPLTGAGVSRLDDELLDVALLATDAANRQLAAVASSPRPVRAAKSRKKAVDLPPASLHCEDRSLAVLRRGWHRDDERLAVLFAGQECNVELIASSQVAVSGRWQLEVSRQGRPLPAVSDWESVCWHSDADVDYLELQIELAEDVIVQRHMVLAREDRFLMLADAIIGPHEGGLEYRGILPLADGVEFRPAAETREGVLAGAASKGHGAGSKALAQVLPLALPEWRADELAGRLYTTDRGLELQMASDGRRMFAPLFLDLDRARFRSRLTWRRLTIGESLLSVPADRAAGYRVALGRQQWLVYRSLGPVSNRTLLGHNLSTETLVARFGDDGEVTSIIEIE